MNGIRIDPDRLLLERSRRGLSQSALAERAGLAYLTVSRIERGSSGAVHAVTAHKLAGALALDVEDLTRALRTGRARRVCPQVRQAD